MANITPRTLRAWGFCKVAEFLLPSGRKSAVCLSNELAAKPAVYAQTIDNKIMYIGSCKRLRYRALAAVALCNRQWNGRHATTAQGSKHGRRPLPSPGFQLRAALRRGDRVVLYAYFPRQRKWNGLAIPFALAIESALIANVHPPWNRTQR
jgi:hypothetical protein